MQVLVDSSVWIDYFRGNGNTDRLDYLIDENILAVNDLILAELIPFLKIKREHKLITLLSSVINLELNIVWDQITELQYQCLKNGINGVGIPDLIIAQNAIQHRCDLYSLDKHFELMKDVFKLTLIK